MRVCGPKGGWAEPEGEGGGGFSGISGHGRKISGDNKKINTVSEKTMCVEWGSSKLFRLTTPRLKEGRISDLQTPAYV